MFDEEDDDLFPEDWAEYRAQFERFDITRSNHRLYRNPPPPLPEEVVTEVGTTILRAELILAYSVPPARQFEQLATLARLFERQDLNGGCRVVIMNHLISSTRSTYDYLQMFCEGVLGEELGSSEWMPVEGVLFEARRHIIKGDISYPERFEQLRNVAQLMDDPTLVGDERDRVMREFVFLTRRVYENLQEFQCEFLEEDPWQDQRN